LIHIHIGLPGDALSGLEGLMLFIQPQRVRHALIAELILKMMFLVGHAFQQNDRIARKPFESVS